MDNEISALLLTEDSFDIDELNDESYVIEPLARKMLADDEQLRKEFEAKKVAEPEFAKDQQAIINWFYNKSLWQDKQMNVYPVGRIMDRNALNGIK